MDKLQKQQSQSLSTPLCGKELEIVAPLFYINILTPYRVDDTILELWSININRLLPDVDPQEISDLMDAFMKNEVEWDRNLGIQNIFLGLQEKFPAKYRETKMVY